MKVCFFLQNFKLYVLEISPQFKNGIASRKVCNCVGTTDSGFNLIIAQSADLKKGNKTKKKFLSRKDLFMV